jgi:hypothetical protein
MGSSANAERVATLVAAVSLSFAITAPAVAYADPGSHRTPGHSESSKDGESSSPSGDSNSSTKSPGDRGVTSPGHTPISNTRSFPGHTNKPFENASPNSRFRPPANGTGDGPDTQPRGKFVFGRHGCDEDPPTPPQMPENPEAPTVPEMPPETQTHETPDAPGLPEPPAGGDFTPPQPEFRKPTVTFSWPAQMPDEVATLPAPPAVVPSEPLSEAQIGAVEAPVAPEPIEVPAAPATVEANADTVVTLTSRIGTGAMALTAILIVLMTGVWFYGNRLASHLTRRNDHA